MDECPQGARLRPGSECSARVLAEALSKIAPSNEADTQSILGKFRLFQMENSFIHFYLFLLLLSDNHVQRIWADQTPLRSPGAPSPRPWSPENRRRLPPNAAAIQVKVSGQPQLMTSSAYGAGYFQRSSAHHRRKDKVFVCA